MADTIDHVPALPAAIAAATDPCLAFVTAWKVGRDYCSNGQGTGAETDAFWDEHVKPFEDQAATGTIPTATTMQGAVSALQMVFHIAADEGDTPAIEPQDASLIRAALDYLAAEPSPDLMAGSSMHAIIEAHRAALLADDQRGSDSPADDAERKAWEVFALAPCAIPADVQAKVAYLTSTERLSDWIDGGVDHQLDLVRSLRLPPPTVSPISLRVNALFGSIVALEAEQYATSDDKADALGARVLALHDELWALRDTQANADLLAARIMLGLMLRNCWQELDRVEWSIDDRFDLDTLSFLTDRLTGEVRRQAALALSTIGLTIDAGQEVQPDPLLALIEAYRAGVEIQNAIPDDEWDEKARAVEAEHIKPHHARLETDPPAATSLAGVMAALQLVADENDIGDTPDLTAAVSRAALAYFRRAA